VQQGLAETRAKARAIIMSGRVYVDHAPLDKPGRLVDPGSKIEIKGLPLPYVSRGGLKLEAALEHFSVDVQGKTLLDVGASTGGFTDCLLQRGARRVIAVDVGYGQLDWRLRKDERVRVLERTNIRYLSPHDLQDPVQGAVIDVSFISLRLVVPPVSRLLQGEGFVIALVKPQFEVGRGRIGKGGVVRDERLHREVLQDLEGVFGSLGWEVIGHLPSPLLGPKGNREFLVYMRR
jgi:23S rRNA (cytidine1920-2'-O)/16S rRNA (cytidine1409-2'-O)-methyltransferase